MLATLRTIASIWKQERQTKNALEIARQGGALYDKFVGFLEDMQKRNHDDQTRALAPHKPADDAIIIDSANLTPKVVVDRMMAVIEKGEGASGG